MSDATQDDLGQSAMQHAEYATEPTSPGSSVHILHAMLVMVMLWLSIDFQLRGDRLASPALSAFRGVATQPQWSYLFLLAAVVGITGIVSRNVWVQRVSMLALSTAHICIALMFSQGRTEGGGIPIGTGTYAAIAAAGYALCLVHFVPSFRRFLK